MHSLATIPNPFHSSIVSDPWKSLEAHVPTIHEWAFKRCCEAIARVRATHQTAGMLVHGGAGSGKTHLLARLRSHIAQEAAADGPGGLEESIFVSVQLQTSARMIWRHLRRCFASDLLRREEGAISQFERLLLHRLIRADLVPDDGTAWLEQVRREKCGDHRLEQVVGDLFGRIDAQGQIGYKLRRVIVSLLMKHHLSEASAWLRGESLPKPALQKLGIDVSLNDDEESGEAEDQDDQDRQVVFGLCSLATAELPLVFCFDQVEALQAHPGDTSGLFAFGQLVSNLHAATRHLLIVSCIQSAFLDRLKSGVQQADFARIKEFGEVALNPLTYAEVKQLIRTRLETLPELKPLRARESNPLWPLPESEILAAYVHADRTPRRLLTRCDELYEVCRQRRDVAPPPPTDQFLDQELERRRQQALEDSEPLQTQSIIEHGLPALVYLAGNGWRQRGPEGPCEVDLWFEGPSGHMAVSICNVLHAPTLVKKLERLKAQLGTPPLGNLTLLRDIRLPVGPKAIKTRAAREELIKKGARWITPSVEALAALAALRRLLADAQSGDLANRGRTVELKTVQEWLSANLATELKELLEEILPTGSGVEPIDIYDWPLYEDMAELLQRHHVVSVADIAARLERGEKEIAACAQQHSNHIGIFGEPSLVLFRMVGNSPAD